MELPSQVAQAERQAEDMITKLNNQGRDPGKPETQDPDKPADQALPETPTQAQPDDKKEETVESLKQQLSETQHQLSVWQGKYKAEVEPIKEDVTFIQKAKGEIRQLRSQISDLLRVNSENGQLISELRKQMDKKPKPEEPGQPAAPKDPSAVLSDEEMAHLQREDLSGETLNIIWKLASEAAAANRAPTQDYTNQFTELSNKVDQVNQRVEQTVQKSWQQQLKEAVKNYDKYFGETADPSFVAWLDAPVSAYSRRTNREELQQGINTQDLDQVVNGIQAYEALRTPGQKPQPKDPLASQIEPDETIQGGQKPLGEKKQYHFSEVQKFLTDQTKGLWRGREKEAAALNQEYIRASKEGRIIP